MQQPRRQWFFNMGDRRALKRTFLAIGGAVAAMLGVLFLAVWQKLFWLTPLAMVAYFATLAAVLHYLVYNRQPSLWCARERGLTAVRLVVWRTYPWATISDVSDGDDGAVLRTTQGDVPLGSNTLNWRLLADLVRQRIGQNVEREPVDEREVTIPPETVAAWLELAPGEVLHLRSRQARTIALALLAGVALVSLEGLLLHTWRPIVAGFAGGLVGGLLGAVWMRRMMRSQNAQAKEIRATGEALEVRCEQGWRRIPWGSLLKLEARPVNTHLLSTTSGDVVLAQWFDKRRLLPAIERAIAARSEGEVLPRLVGGDVPEGALSRAVAGTEVSERGVSRADG